MLTMLPIIVLIFILTLIMLIMKVATVALIHTGLSHESARFQVRSAFLGVGYTTAETEKVVNHPVRRRIIMLLMLFGNASIFSVLATTLITFLNTNQDSLHWPYRVFALAGGILVLALLGNSPFVNRVLSRIIEWALHKWTSLDVRDYASLLHLSGDYSIAEVMVEAGSWMADKTLIELDLRREGVLMIGIQCKDGTYNGAPFGHTEIKSGDVVLLYGREAVLTDLAERRIGEEGEASHRHAVAEQEQFEELIETSRHLRDDD